MNTTTLAYRDSLEGARLRYADLRARDTPGLDGMRAVFASRTGRIYAGVTGIAGAALMTLSVFAFAVDGGWMHTNWPAEAPFRPSAPLFLAWPAMGLAYLVGRLAGGARADRTVTPPETGDVHTDLARLESMFPAAELRRRATGLERASTALPMIAFALLAPLSLHALVCMTLWGWSDFDSWIRLSLVVVGHAHLALAFMYWRFAKRAAGLTSLELAQERSGREWGAYGVTVVASALPGAILFLIPPVLTGVTALVFHPLLFRKMTGALIAERKALA